MSLALWFSWPAAAWWAVGIVLVVGFIGGLHALALHEPDAPVRQIGLGLYAAAYAVFFWFNGVIIDRISVTLSVLLLLAVASVGKPARRWMLMALDITLYALMWFVYENTRGAGDSLGMPLQVEAPRNIDRALFFGADPNVWMQRHLFSSDVSTYSSAVARAGIPVRWYDVFGSILYYTHFVIPPMVIAILWIVKRSEWARFMRRFATLLFVSCITFVLAPTAPPWMAAGVSPYKGKKYDVLDPLVRITGRGASHIGLDGFVRTWDRATQAKWSNPVAAMPSLHAGFAFLIVMFFWPKIRQRWISVALLVVYPIGMIAALVYFGEHYVADALGAWLIIGASFWFWGWIESNYVWRNWWFAERSDAPKTLEVSR